MMNHTSRHAVLVLARLALVSGMLGCSESTMIRTHPPNASVYVDGQFIGVTPVVYSVPESRFSGREHYRIEHEGYEPLEGELRTHIAGGRVVGGLFAVGIPFLFRGPTAFHDRHDFDLQPVANAANGQPLVEPVHRDPAAPVDAGGAAGSSAAEAKLRQLQDLYDRGLISSEEYRETRARIIRGL